jgi:tetrapyrrole methylase family protein/MazG family protein
MPETANKTLADEFTRFVEVVRELRRSCPWDREQTHATLTRYLIEEAFEAVAAIDAGDPRALADELGDVLLQVALHATIAEESGSFELAELIRQGTDKLIRRHPHVFGELSARNAAEVTARWEQIKREERRAVGLSSTLDAIPAHLPALIRAEKLGHRARHAGMDWADIRAVLAKVREELDEVELALEQGRPDEAGAELGDALLALSNAPRFLEASAEEVLRRACDKFIYRFKIVEAQALAEGRTIAQMSPAEADAAWERAKQQEN